MKKVGSSYLKTTISHVYIWRLLILLGIMGTDKIPKDLDKYRHTWL